MVQFDERGKAHISFSKETMEPIADAILDMLEDIETEVMKGKPVYVLHFPRGATPIVDSIEYARTKLRAWTKRSFNVIKVPVSRENMDTWEADAKIREALADVPNGATVFYLDETVSGRNSKGNIKSVIGATKNKGISLRANLLVSSDAKYLEYAQLKQFRNFQRNPVVKIRLHIVPFDIPWSDFTAALGFNWGLMHKFPRKVLELGLADKLTPKELGALLKKWEREFEAIYFERIGKKRGKVLQVKHDDPRYSDREKIATDCMYEAARRLGYAEEYNIRRLGDHGLSVLGTNVIFHRLSRYLFDDHPSHILLGDKAPQSKRRAYQEMVTPDNLTLVDIRGLSDKSVILTKALQAAVGAEVHKRRADFLRKFAVPVTHKRTTLPSPRRLRLRSPRRR